MSFKGYPSSGKQERLGTQFATVEPIRENQDGLTVLAHAFVYAVGTDTAEAGSSTTSIVATAHAAKRGDVIRFTSGALSGQEVKVLSKSANAIVPAEDLATAPSNGDAFQVLRHKYPTVDSAGVLQVNASVTAPPIQYTRDAVATNVSEDTATPGNSRPLPVKVVDAGGIALDISAGGEAYVADADARASLASLDSKAPTKGQKVKTGSVPVVLASDSDALPITAAALPLPSGAATSAKQDSLQTSLDSLNGKVTAVNTGAVVVSSSALPTGAATEATLAAASAKLPATLGQKAKAASLAVTLASDQDALPASQSGTWNVRNQDGSGNAITSVALGSARAIQTAQVGSTAVDKARKASGTVTSAAYTQLVAALAGECQSVEVFDSSGVSLILAVGAAASEVDQFYIIPGGNGRVPLRIPSGSRVSVKATGTTADYTSSELLVNFYS